MSNSREGHGRLQEFDLSSSFEFHYFEVVWDRNATDMEVVGV